MRLVLFMLLLLTVACLAQLHPILRDANDNSTTPAVTTPAADNTTSPAPEPNTTTSHPNATTPEPSTLKPTNAPSPCSSLYNCTSCASNHDCVWCATSDACVPGGWYGPKPLRHTFTSCRKWFWRKCGGVDMQIIRYVVLGAAGAVLLLLLCVCFICCCCCRSRPQPEDTPKTAAERIELEQQERLLGKDSLNNKPADPASRHPRTDEWRQKMRQRYGIGGNSNDV